MTLDALRLQCCLSNVGVARDFTNYARRLYVTNPKLSFNYSGCSIIPVRTWYFSAYANKANRNAKIAPVKAGTFYVPMTMPTNVGHFRIDGGK